MRSEVSRAASLARLPLRYGVAFCLIPIGLLLGLVGLLQGPLRRLAGPQRPSRRS